MATISLTIPNTGNVTSTLADAAQEAYAIANPGAPAVTNLQAVQWLLKTYLQAVYIERRLAIRRSTEDAALLAEQQQATTDAAVIV